MIASESVIPAKAGIQCCICHSNPESFAYRHPERAKRPKDLSQGRLHEGEESQRCFTLFSMTNCSWIPTFVGMTLLVFFVYSCTREAAEQKGKDKISETRDDMVLVDAGEFIMGSDRVEIKEEALKPLEPLFKAEAPKHKVSLKAFYIDKYEVTNQKYKKFVEATKIKPPANWRDGEYEKGRENHPVTLVSWYDADEYCRWAGKRLPTESEWEKAARGKDERKFPWGNEFDGSKANTEESKLDDTMPVGSFESGKSPYGVYDMIGNVWEWTADFYQPYQGNKEPNDFYGDAFRVARGGAHGTSGGHYIIQELYRTSFRFFFAPDRVYTDVGFRCAKDER